jgi:hypothetical protein
MALVAAHKKQVARWESRATGSGIAGRRLRKKFGKRQRYRRDLRRGDMLEAYDLIATEFGGRNDVSGSYDLSLRVEGIGMQLAEETVIQIRFKTSL